LQQKFSDAWAEAEARKPWPSDRETGQETEPLSLLEFAARVYPGYQATAMHRAIAGALEHFLAEVEAERSPRLLITCPPRHGKSLLTSVLFPAYVMGRHPDWPIIHTSYTAELSNDFSRAVRDLLPEPEYQQVFPGVFPAKNSKGVKRWGIEGRRGAFVSVGIGGPLTGRGAKILLIDDPLKNRQAADSAVVRKMQRDWYGSTAYTRLEKGGGVLLILTRWVVEDLGGYVTTGAGADTPPADMSRWQILNLPAIAEANDPLGRAPGEALWPEKYDETALALLRGTLPTRDWLALYQQRPVAESGNLLEVDKIQHRVLSTEQRAELTIYQAWDLAISAKASADYTVCATWGIDGDMNAYLLDLYRARITFHETIQMMGKLGEAWQPQKIGIETAGYQSAAFQEASRAHMLPFREVKPDKDKATRATLLAARIAAGKVFADRTAPWWRTFEEEAKAFPVGEHDDMVDASVYALLLAGFKQWWEDADLTAWLKGRGQPEPAAAVEEKKSCNLMQM
jgi:predicted phage terminase large subunit-like protein